MIEALQKSMGNISHACKQVGITRETHYEWKRTDAVYEAEVRDVVESAIDYVESKLMLQIQRDNYIAIIFYLKTKGKHRGWTERVENTGPDGGPISHVVRDMSQLSDEELLLIAYGHKKSDQ